MSHKNPIHEAIHKAVKPMFNTRKQTVEGTVMKAEYEKQLVRVYWMDPDSGAERQSANVPLPIDGDGIFKQSVEEGDHVTISFKNGNHMNPYITVVHKKQRGVSFKSENGAGIPKGMGFL